MIGIVFESSTFVLSIICVFSTKKTIINVIKTPRIKPKMLPSKIFKLLNIMPAVPSFVLNLMLGDMSKLLLDSSFISSKKIEDAGFYFKYPELGPALRSLL